MIAAKEINREANFDYGINDTPMILRKGGPISQLWFQFMKYPIKELEFMINLVNKGSKKQNVEFWAPYIAMCGVFQLPMAGLVYGLFSSLFDWDIEKETKEWIMAEFGDNWASRIPRYGILGAANIDISQRVGMAAPYDSALSGGAAISTVRNMIYQSSQGNPVETIKAFSPALGNYLQAAVGESRTSRGRLSNRYEGFYDRMLKALGFRSADEAVASDLQMISRYENDNKRQREQNAIDDYLSASNSAERTKYAKRLRELHITKTRVDNERKRKEQSRMERTQGSMNKDIDILPMPEGRRF